MLIKRNKLVFLTAIIILISLIIFSPYLINNMPLTYGTDIKPQWFEFYTEFKNLIILNSRLFIISKFSLLLRTFQILF